MARLFDTHWIHSPWLYENFAAAGGSVLLSFRTEGIVYGFDESRSCRKLCYFLLRCVLKMAEERPLNRKYLDRRAGGNVSAEMLRFAEA